MDYYAVKAGHKVGVFENWKECQTSINGFPGALFKKFKTKEEAEAYIDGTDIYLENAKKDIDNGYLVAYTDGSFDKITKQYSYGVLIIDRELREIELSGSSRNESYSDSANIAGEVFGVINALDWAVSNGYDKIKIYHDYNGLSEWATGRWKAKTTIAILLVNILSKKYADIIEIEFEHVSGHSNNRFNNKADELAANALSGQVRIPITGSNWFSVQKVRNSELEAVLQILVEEEPSVKLVRDARPDKIIYRLSLNHDRLTITSHLTGQRTLLVQGNANLLFQVVTSYVQDLLDNGTMAMLLSSAYRKTIDKSVVKESFDSIFGKIPHDYPDNNVKLIKQSIINLNYYVESEDYGQYAYPALRALEGHIKFYLSKAGITITTKTGFFCFNKDLNGDYIMTQTGTLTSDQIICVVEMYKYYYDNRHSLFHFGDIIGTVDATRMIDEKAVADEIINECLILIAKNI